MQQAFGYDYGTRPKVIVAGDGNYPRLLQKSLIALGYGQLPHFGNVFDAPLLALMFDDEQIGRDCFTHFKGWTNHFTDGDAVTLNFIEFDNGEYGLCISQEKERLVNQCLPDYIQPEVDPLLMVVGYLKIFGKQSSHYKWFKQAVKRSPCVIALATKEGEPFLEYAFSKREIHFYREQEVPEQTLERNLLRARNDEAFPERNQAFLSESRPGTQEIYRKRQSQLKRFFPVTTERLRFNPQFRQTKQSLLHEGYQDWQVMQAGCNIALQLRQPELYVPAETPGSDEKDRSIKLQVLDFLLQQGEDLSAQLPGEEALTKAKLLAQIVADSHDLLHYILSPENLESCGDDIQQELVKHGFVPAK